MKTGLELAGIFLLISCYADMVTVDYGKNLKWVYRLTHKYWMQQVWRIFLFGISMILILQSLVPAILDFGKSGMIFKIIIVVRVVLCAAGIFIYMFLYWFEVNPIKFIRLIGGNNFVNHIETPESKTTAWEDDYYITNDIRFESRYPNNSFDMYTNERDFNKKHPVFIYAHGGGYIWGDKTNGDPNALGIAGIIRMIKQLLDEGFTVISTNYVLAPDYTYPAPVQQMTELLEYLKKNADALGIDMNQVVVGGGSAGGHIMAQLTNVQTNSEYAKEMKIMPVLTNGEIKAVYHGCALLDNERFGHTGSKIVDYTFYQMGRIYFNTKVLEGNSEVLQSSVISNVTKDYPPSFICDGNAGTFNAQAHDLADKLNALGVKNEAFIYDGPEDEKLPHGFDTLEYEVGCECMKAMVKFVSREVGAGGSKYV